MPAKAYYDLANDENYDIKIPAYPEEAFQQGIRFGAKYIGTQDISRPASRVEIVAAMRHIRYEYKAKGVKKRSAVLSISVTGIEVYYQKRHRKTPVIDNNCVLLMKHPTYRVFYVSHDSQDLKIFSYIARDSGSNVFRCSVFKAYKKTDAILIVRTIGQAFEVCHKMNQHIKDSDSQHDNESDKSGCQSESRPGNTRLANSDSVHSTRSADNGSLHKSESTTSAAQAHQTGVSASSTATSGFMQSSMYSADSLPNTFAALLKPAAAGGPVNVETAIKTAQELLRYASTVYRRPPAHTPGSVSLSASFHDSVSMPRSPSALQADLLAEVASASTGNQSVANGNPPSVLGSVAPCDRLQNGERFANEVPNVASAIAEAKQRLLQEQLIQETALRIEAQARVQQLLVINKQLTQHIHRLSERVQRLQADLSKLQCSTGPTMLSGDPQNPQNNCLPTANYSVSLVSTHGGDVPRLEPPPSMHRHHLRMGTCRSASRDSFSTSAANGQHNHVPMSAGFNNLDLFSGMGNQQNGGNQIGSAANAGAPHKVLNGLKNDHLLIFSSPSGSEDENNKKQSVRACNGSAE